MSREMVDERARGRGQAAARGKDEMNDPSFTPPGWEDTVQSAGREVLCTGVIWQISDTKTGRSCVA